MAIWAEAGVILALNAFPLTVKITEGDYIKIPYGVGVFSYNVIPSVSDVKAGTAYGWNLRLVGTLISGGGSAVNVGRWSC